MRKDDDGSESLAPSLSMQWNTSVTELVGELSECRSLISGIQTRATPIERPRAPHVTFQTAPSFEEAPDDQSPLASSAQQISRNQHVQEENNGDRPRERSMAYTRSDSLSHLARDIYGLSEDQARDKLRTLLSEEGNGGNGRRPSVSSRRSSVTSNVSEISSLHDDDVCHVFSPLGKAIYANPSCRNLQDSSHEATYIAHEPSIPTLEDAKRKPLLIKSTTCGQIVIEDNLEPLVCELEYPLMCDSDVLFLSRLPENFVLRCQDSDDLMERIRVFFGDTFRDDIKLVHVCREKLIGTFIRIYFTSTDTAHRAKEASESFVSEDSDLKGVLITFSKPYPNSHRPTDLFISNFPTDDKYALAKCLKKCSSLPLYLTRLAADYDIELRGSIKKQGSKDPKKIIWRAQFPNEEAARNSHAALSLLKGRGVDGHKFDTSYQPNAFTKGLVICFRTPGVSKLVLQKLKFHHPVSKTITEEFEYALKHYHQGVEAEDYRGNVLYDISDCLGTSHGYARLVTSNWWYATMFWALIYASLALLDVYSNIVYAANLFTSDNTNSLLCNTDFRYNFLVSFFGLQFFILWNCWKESRYTIESQVHDTGDLIHGKTAYDELILQLASFTFFFMQIPGMVKDIVKTLHPWTNVQEKVAAKMFGTRVFIIGYRHAPMYRCSDQAGMHKQYPPIMLGNATLTLFKMWHSYTTGSYTTILLCVTSVLLWPTQYLSFRNLLNDRRAYMTDLQSEAIKVGLDTTSLTKLRSEDSHLTPKQKGVLNNWKRYYSELDDLTKYSRLKDAMPWDFWRAIAILAIANGFIIFLILAGVLKAGVSLPPQADLMPDTNSSIALRDLLAADVDGDGRLSPAELLRIGLHQLQVHV